MKKGNTRRYPWIREAFRQRLANVIGVPGQVWSLIGSRAIDAVDWLPLAQSNFVWAPSSQEQKKR